MSPDLAHNNFTLAPSVFVCSDVFSEDVPKDGYEVKAKI